MAPYEDLFRNKIILAPMVRVGTLPMRLLSLKYGADLVYSEEIVDWKFLKSVRIVNNTLQTVDFIDPTDGTIIFRTCSEEKNKVIVQLGTCDPNRALKVAEMIKCDIAGIDINMGCPKEFSLKGGMGAALLSQPEKAKLILRTLIENVDVPITCKIRVFEDFNDTLKLVKELVSTGISAIAIHGRTKFERPQHQNRNDTIRKIAENVSIPVIANGGSKGIGKYEDILNFKKNCGSSSVMVARAAEGNCSIFSKSGMKDLDEVIVEYLKLAIEYDNSPSNTKYCVQNMLKELQETPRGKKFLECQTLEQICAIWNLGDYCRQKQIEFQTKGMLGRRNVRPDMFSPNPKKLKVDHDDNIVEVNCAFIRVNYTNDPELPKSRLLAHSNKLKVEHPKYRTICEDKLFRAIVTFQNKKYTSTYWEKNKRFAEQGAALACVYSLGLMNKDELVKNGSILE